MPTKIKPSWLRLFLVSAGVLLLATACAKFLSAASNSGMLKEVDPLFGVSFRTIFWTVGTLEAVLAVFCFFGSRAILNTSLVAWLATNFLFYRFALKSIDYRKPCGCLGNLTDALHVSPETADVAMKMVLGYLLIGSYAGLLWLWRRGNIAVLEDRPMNRAM